MMPFANRYRPGRGFKTERYTATPRRTLADERLALTPLGPSIPRTVDGADWQAGITPGHNRFRVYLNGEPVVSAFAASVVAGWVDVYRCDADVTAAVYDDALSDRARIVRRTGIVELRRTASGA